jgi:hypothetical protein
VEGAGGEETDLSLEGSKGEPMSRNRSLGRIVFRPEHWDPVSSRIERRQQEAGVAGVGAWLLWSLVSFQQFSSS